jgi:hypothetical protein
LTAASTSGRGQQLCRLRATLAEDADVGVAEAVDRLELVADVEDLGFGSAQEIDEIALQLVRVLELVDHDRAEAQRLAFADRLVLLQQVARAQLQILEVQCGLARLRLVERLGIALEQLLQQIAIVRSQLIERGLLDGTPRVLVGRRAFGRARLEAGEVEQPVRLHPALQRREQLRRRRPLVVGRGSILREAARRLAQLLDPLRELRATADLERQVAAGGAKRLVDAGQHAPQAVAAVGREQAEPVGLPVRAEQRERLAERLAP